MDKVAFYNAIVPINNSELSERVVLKAAELVQKGFIKNIVLLSVWETDEIDLTKLHSSEKAEKLKLTAQAVLDKYKTLLNQEGIPAKYVCVGGEPSKIIIQAVEDTKYDLIIMGSRKLNKAKELLWGSVSDKVTRLVDVPVLVIK